MPYSQDYIGIYKITNKVNGKHYIGQSVNVRKRIQEHFRLLDLGKHTNEILQRAYNKHGRGNFEWSLEVDCVDASDLDDLENEFLQGRASFSEAELYNIADTAKVPMRGKHHTDATRKKMSEKRQAANHIFTSQEYKARCSESQRRRALGNPEYLAIVTFIVNNPHMSYGARGRAVGKTLSAARKIALKYSYIKEKL